MADSRAQVPTFAPMSPSNTLIQNFIYVFVTIVAVLVLKRLIIFVWYCISSLGDWIIGNFENTRIDYLPSRCRMAATEEPNSEELVDPDKLSCESPRVEAGNSSETSRTMEQKNDRDVKNFEDSLKRVIEGKGEEEEKEEEDVKSMRDRMKNNKTSIADFVVADEIDRRFRENLAEENRKFNEEIEELRQQTSSIESFAEKDNQELHCRKSLLPRLDDD